MSRCKPGDLAVVVDAEIKANLGRIVSVVALQDGTGLLGAIGPKPVWLVTAPTPLSWRDGAKKYRLKSGPVPDLCLQPIRGAKVAGKAAAASKKKRNETAPVQMPSMASLDEHTCDSIHGHIISNDTDVTFSLGVLV